MRLSLGAIVLCLLARVSVFAQASPGGPDGSKVRLRIGPLYLNPTLSLTNIGRDNNVFNEPDQLEPKSDFTMTVTPATDVWLRAGRTWFRATIREDLVWYQTYANERSSNENVALSWAVPLNRLVVNLGGTYLNVRDRPGFEIDARSQRAQWDSNGSVELRAFAKTFIGAKGTRKNVDFDSVSTFEGINLHDALNRTESSGAVTVRHELTPLTTLTLLVGHQWDRFDFSPARDTDSNAVTFTVAFDPFALLKGSATVGYRNFRPADRTLSGFTGTTAAVDLSYVLAGSTKVGAQINRDVQYSFELADPFYVLTGGALSVSQQIFGPVDVVGRVGLQRLNYASDTAVAAADAGRVDRVYSYGGGFGYHLGQDLRIGFNIDNQKRISTVNLREYSGLRFGFAVTYGS